MDLPWVDPNDPNYDSAGEEGEKAVSKAGKNIKLNTLVPEMSEDDVKKAVEPLIQEFFENDDTEDRIINTVKLVEQFAESGLTKEAKVII